MKPSEAKHVAELVSTIATMETAMGILGMLQELGEESPRAKQMYEELHESTGDHPEIAIHGAKHELTILLTDEPERSEGTPEGIPGFGS